MGSNLKNIQTNKQMHLCLILSVFHIDSSKFTSSISPSSPAVCNLGSDCQVIFFLFFKFSSLMLDFFKLISGN